MNATATISASSTRPTVARTYQLARNRKFWKIGILISGSLGNICGFLGLLSSFESFFGVTKQSLSGIGTVLIAASFPLLFLAAHCMDKSGEIEKAIRLNYCRQHGLKDDEC